VADEGVTVFDYHLSATGEIRAADPFDVFADAEFRRFVLAHRFSND
jgi:hypothetical protein